MTTKTDKDEVQPATKLPYRQEAFVEHYLACWNGAEAARRAGYAVGSAKVTACNLLKEDAVRLRIAERMAEFHAGADEVLARLTDAARADMRDFLTVRMVRDGEGAIVMDPVIDIATGKPVMDPVIDDDGKPVLDFVTKMPQMQVRKAPRRCIDIDLEKALDANRTHLLKKVGYNKFGQLEIELVDAQQAQVHLGRHHVLFTDKTEGSLGEPDRSAIDVIDKKLSDLADRLPPPS